VKKIWLSHILESGTPHYGGTKEFQIEPNKSISQGDSANTSNIRLSSHSGTHVDVPYHFYEDGKKISDYSPENWIFDHPVLVDIEVESGDKIGTNQIKTRLSTTDELTDIVLIRTGFEKKRLSVDYWAKGPAFDPEIADFLNGMFPRLRAVGIDCISISSLEYRDVGRETHRRFLGRDILIIEDMALSKIPEHSVLNQLMVFPLRTQMADGAPCTVVGIIR
jgi:kynurenine formamidase